MMFNDALTPVLKPPERRDLPELLADTIAEAIASRALAPGDRIVETSFAIRMGVSRVPLREALKVLQAQGILAGGGHKGFRVVTFDARTIRQVLDVRVDLEVQLLKDAIVRWRAGEATLLGLEDALEAMRRAMRAGDLTAALKTDVAFHRAICEAADNAIAATLWKAIARHVLIIFSFERESIESLDGHLEMHRAFLQFIRAQIDRPGPVTDIRSMLSRHILLLREGAG